MRFLNGNHVDYTSFYKNIQIAESHEIFLNFSILKPKMFLTCSYFFLFPEMGDDILSYFIEKINIKLHKALRIFLTF